MSLTLEQLAAECRRALQAHPGVEGRRQVCALVEEACKDQSFRRRALQREHRPARHPL